HEAAVNCPPWPGGGGRRRGAVAMQPGGELRDWRRPAGRRRLHRALKDRTTMDITRAGSKPSGKGPADWFTGTVRIDPLFTATATTAMTHIAIQEALDGKAVEWMEHVTDEQYGAGTHASRSSRQQ